MCLLLMPQAPTPPPQIRHDVSLEISVRLTFLAQLISWSSATTINNFRSNWEMQVTGHWTDVDRRAQGLSYIQIVYNVNFRWIRFKRLIRKVRALFNAFKNIDLLLKQYLYFSHLGWLVGNHIVFGPLRGDSVTYSWDEKSLHSCHLLSVTFY